MPKRSHTKRDAPSPVYRPTHQIEDDEEEEEVQEDGIIQSNNDELSQSDRASSSAASTSNASSPSRASSNSDDEDEEEDQESVAESNPIDENENEVEEENSDGSVEILNGRQQSNNDDEKEQESDDGAMGSELRSNHDAGGEDLNHADGETPNDNQHDDPELLFFLKHGRFEDDLVLERALPKRLVDAFRPRDYDRNEIQRLVNREVAKMTLAEQDVKERLKMAIKEVMLEKKQRRQAIVEHLLDWSLFTSTITRVYDQLDLSAFGVKSRKIPEFELNLLEICLDKQENEKPKNPTDSSNKNAEDGSVTDGPAKKKVKMSSDGFRAGPSSHQLNPSNRRLGDCVPEHWRAQQHVDLVKFCIRKSVDLTMSLKSDRNDLEGTLNKCRAIEQVILDNGNAKTAAINYGINYSTLHNYTHRAMVTIAKVFGDAKIPEKTQQMLKKKAPYEEICKVMNVKRAPTLARFVSSAQKEA